MALADRAENLNEPTVYDPGPMRLLLPPSETKLSGGSGPPLQLADLGFPELNPLRTLVASQLVALASDPHDCRRVLGLSPRQDAEIARNAELFSSPTMPALERYTGVLYDAVGTDDLTPAARRRAGGSIVICSALFGVVRADDFIPAYRCSAGNNLPGVGSLRTLWKARLTEAVCAAGPIVDLRSGAYAALGEIPGAIGVRVIRTDGRSVSHFNKAAKGRLVRAFLTARRRPATIDALVRAASAADLTLRAVDERQLELII